MGFLSTNLVSKFVVHLIWLLVYCIFRIQAQKKERCCPWRFIQLCFNCYPTIHIYPFVCFPFTHAHSLLLVNFALHICRLAKFTLYMSKEKVVAFLEAYWLSIWLVLAFMLFLLLICDDWCPCPEVFLMFFCVSIALVGLYVHDPTPPFLIVRWGLIIPFWFYYLCCSMCAWDLNTWYDINYGYWWILTHARVMSLPVGLFTRVCVSFDLSILICPCSLNL